MKVNILFILLSFFMTILGTANHILSKVYFTKESDQFSLTWFFNILMFLGEMFALPIYYLRENISSKRNPSVNLEPEEVKEGQVILEVEEEKPKKKKIFLLIIPSILDTFATFLSNISLTYLYGSIFATLRGTMVITITFLISKFFLKNKHILDHYIAIPILGVGFILVGLSSFFGDSSTENNGIDFEEFTLLSIFMIIISMFMQSIQFCLDEHFMRKYKFNPFFVIGYEGLFGFCFNLFICIILSFIKCGDDPSEFLQKICIKDDNNLWKVENILFSLTEIFTNEKFAIFVIITIIIFAGYNIIQIWIIYYKEAMGRSLVENFRSFLIYIFYILPILSDELREKFNLYRLFGLIIIFVGVITYLGAFCIDERRIIRQKEKYLNDISEIEKGDIVRIGTNNNL